MSTEAERSGLAAVRALQRDGRLVAEFGRLPRMMAPMAPADRARVGAWLAREPGAPVGAHNAIPIRIAVTGNGTVAGLVSHLHGQGAAQGLALGVEVSDFGRYRQDLLDAGSPIYQSAPAIVACVLDGHAIADQLPLPWQVADAEAALERHRHELEAIVRTFAGNAPDGVLVLNTLALDRGLAHQLVDLKSRARLGAAWRRFNAWLLELGLEHERVVTIDLDTAAADVAPAADPRLVAYAHQNLPDGVLARYAVELVHLARCRSGLSRKCLVLDLDNTLWGGALAEVGSSGIVLGDDLEGEAYQRFQQVIAQLSSQGVLLAVCSKNEIDEVRGVLRDHPDVVLREREFAAISANWRPKSHNIEEIAKALNLSPDSFVLVDDSRVECDLVAEAHPRIGVVALESDPALHIESLLRDGWFTVLELTAEDLERTATYRSRAERHGFLDTCESLDQYLAGLGVRVSIATPTGHECKRVSQLTLRTNQFNMTTIRMDLDEVRRRLADPTAWVLAIRSADRFGEDGLVGCVFAQEQGEVLTIENFMLSCRVFSRGIETAALGEVLREARRRGLRRVSAEYRPSPKNAKVSDFYLRHGFEPAPGEPNRLRFVHDLDVIPPSPEHIVIQIPINTEAAA